MHPDIQALGRCLAETARAGGYLSSGSTGAPNAVQNMVYYTAFRGAAGRHRDNWCGDDLLDYLDGVDVFSAAQQQTADVSDPLRRRPGVANSDVLLCTCPSSNCPMDLQLSYPPPRCPRGERKTYKVHPRFKVELAGGTLFILSPRDDLLFCHEVTFSDLQVEFAGNQGIRIAYVFRWLQMSGDFYTHLSKRHAMKPTEMLTEIAAQGQKAKKRKRAQDVKRAQKLW